MVQCVQACGLFTGNRQWLYSEIKRDDADAALNPCRSTLAMCSSEDLIYLEYRRHHKCMKVAWDYCCRTEWQLIIKGSVLIRIRDLRSDFLCVSNLAIHTSLQVLLSYSFKMYIIRSMLSIVFNRWAIRCNFYCSFHDCRIALHDSWCSQTSGNKHS